MELRGTDVSKLMEVAISGWAGRREEEVRELFDRLFRERIAGMVYPEARELVRAHAPGRPHGGAAASAPPAIRRRARRGPRDRARAVLGGRARTRVLQRLLRRRGLWGPAKAPACVSAAARGVDLGAALAYANGDEDVAFLEIGRRPAALNPASGLERVAAERGWPSVELRPARASRIGRRGADRGGARRARRRRRRRDRGRAAERATGGAAANVATSIGPDLALALAGVSLEVTGTEHLWSHRPAVFIFNHQSSIDVAVIGCARTPRPDGRGEDGGIRDPRFAPIGYVTDIAYVDRSNREQARAALQPAVEQLHGGTSIAIAPEGTRSPTPRLGRFKKGAFHLAMQGEVPIVPIVIRNAGDVMWRGSFVIRPGNGRRGGAPPIATDGWKVAELDRRVAGGARAVRQNPRGVARRLGGWVYGN